MSTFRELVNDVIMESKLTLDQLEVVDFPSPPRTSMYDRIKRWVNTSYMELLTEKPEWFFKSRSAVQLIHPRIKLTAPTVQLMLGAIAPGDVFRTQDTGIEFTVLSIDTQIHSDVVGYSLTVDIEYSDASDNDKVVLNEKIDRIAPTSDVDFGRIGGRGTYNFRANIPTLDEFMEGSVEIQEAVDYTDDPNPNSLRGVYPLDYLPWNRWAGTYSLFTAPSGRPIAVCQTADGTFEFYPRPDQPYDVKFNYTQKGTSMVLEGDTPLLLPEKYHPYLMWKTLSEVADFNQDPKLFSRAKKHVDKYMFWMSRDLLPKPSLDLERFDYPTYADARVNGI